MMRNAVKTVAMRLIEQEHGRAPIQQIMIEAYRQHGSEAGAAAALGISQQTFNTWKKRLRLDATLEEIARIHRYEAGAL